MPSPALERLSTVFTAVLVLCAVAVTGMVARREFFPPSAAAPPRALPPLDVSSHWTELTGTGALIGTPRAPVRIVEFSDFQCPFCASVQGTLRTLRARDTSRITIVYRHFPLSSIHPFARQAAASSACADAQGRFEPYHDRLFAQQDSIGVKPWSRFASEAGVPDLPAFSECVRRGEFDGAVQRDVQLGQRVGVTATPTLIVNGRLLRAAPTLETIDQMIADVASAPPRVSSRP